MRRQRAFGLRTRLRAECMDARWVRQHDVRYWGERRVSTMRAQTSQGKASGDARSMAAAVHTPTRS